jgi:hypothetical protein
MNFYYVQLEYYGSLHLKFQLQIIYTGRVILPRMNSFTDDSIIETKIYDVDQILF